MPSLACHARPRTSAQIESPFAANERAGCCTTSRSTSTASSRPASSRTVDAHPWCLQCDLEGPLSIMRPASRSLRSLRATSPPPRCCWHHCRSSSPAAALRRGARAGIVLCRSRVFVARPVQCCPAPPGPRLTWTPDSLPMPGILIWGTCRCHGNARAGTSGRPGDLLGINILKRFWPVICLRQQEGATKVPARAPRTMPCCRPNWGCIYSPAVECPR